MNPHEEHETICAVATAPGVGGIAVIRLSGPQAHEIASRHLQRKALGVNLRLCPPRCAIYADLIEGDELIDEVIALPFVAPASFTGEDLVEISCHGSTYITQRILQALIRAGARMARPGEFTQRAFFNGKIDLTEAEAVADLIASETQAQHKMAMQQMKGAFRERLAELRAELLRLTALMELELDFPEEEVEFADRTELLQLTATAYEHTHRLANSYHLGNAIKSGIPVALVGATNVGKSTLLNTLLGEARAIVSDIPGTTRDTIEETVSLGGYLFRFVDTAGFRNTADQIEQLGIDRSKDKMLSAQIILLLIDPTHLDDPEQKEILQTLATSPLEGTPLWIINKRDIATSAQIDAALQYLISLGIPSEQCITLTARQEGTLDPLRKRLVDLMNEGEQRQTDLVVTNARHYDLLTTAANALSSLETGLAEGVPTELLTLELRTAIDALGEITGATITSDERLHYIFAHFCIGK